jgi:hypothetical protein
LTESRLPQARMYLRAAQWGLDNLVKHSLEGYAFRFHAVGILAALRAVQHALYNHDRHLSPAHHSVITEWWESTLPRDHPDLRFIQKSRNLILKEGSFNSYAIYSESGSGEGENRTITHREYELVYYEEDERRDLRAAVLSALNWCDLELTKIEARLPTPG